jgi:hypothetical protein
MLEQIIDVRIENGKIRDIVRYSRGMSDYG